MKPDNRSRTRTRPPAINKPASNPRTPRAIRFSESEWQQVRSAAAKRGISFGGFVREAALAHAAGPTEGESAGVRPGIEELIKQTFRYSFILASIKRDELVRDRRDRDIENIIELAGIAQDELLSGHS